MSGYQLQENEIEFQLPTPTPDSKFFISCILSKPEKNGKYPETLRSAMLMHGIGSHKNNVYNSKLARKLSKDYGMYVVRFDFRNCGGSSKTGKIGRTLQHDIEDMNVVYNWLTNGGFNNKKLFVDTLIGHSRGVVDVFNWQLENKDKFVINLVACAGRFIGNGLFKSLKEKFPNFENEGGHTIKGFQDGKYQDVWVPIEETKSISTLHMSTVKDINHDTDTLCIYGTREQVIPLEDAAHYVNYLGDRNKLVLIPGADHCYRGIVEIPENEWFKYDDKAIIKPEGIINYNYDVAEIISKWISNDEMNERFFEKHKLIHKYLPRFKEIKGFFNFRDFGGYNTNDGKVVKYNLLFRSGNLNENIELDSIKEIEKLNIKQIFDLRFLNENNNGNNSNNKIKTNYLFEKIDINNYEKNYLKTAVDWNLLSESFEYIIEKIIPFSGKEIFNYLSNDKIEPILITSVLGKDRVGVLVILLLLLCNVDPLIIAEEFTLSKQGIKENEDEVIKLIKNNENISKFNFENEFKPNPQWTFSNNGINNLLRLESKVILDTIRRFEDKYGSIEDYLEKQVGLTTEQINKIRSNLLI